MPRPAHPRALRRGADRPERSDADPSRLTAAGHKCPLAEVREGSVTLIWGDTPPERRLSRHASLFGLDKRRGSWRSGGGLRQVEHATTRPPPPQEIRTPPPRFPGDPGPRPPRRAADRPDRSDADPSRLTAADH